MQRRKKTFIINMISVVFFLSIAPIRFLFASSHRIGYNSIIFVLLTVNLFMWFYQVRNRIVDSEKKKYLICLAVMLMLLNVVRTIKYSFVGNHIVLLRYAWYIYYIPITFVALFTFFSVQNIGRPFGMKLNPKYKLLYIPPVLISVGILTNDLHMLAFRFEGSFFEWNDQNCTHGPLFWIAVVWILGMTVAAVSVAFYRCMINSKRKNIWMPLIPLTAGNIYLLFLLFAHPDRQPYTMPEMVIFMFPALMEALIVAGFLPSNDNYRDLWNISHVSVGVMDKNGKIYQNGDRVFPVTKEQIDRAKAEPIRLPDTQLEIKSYDVPGGTGYWIRDVSQVDELQRRIADTGDLLAEENAMLKAENELKENRARVKQSNELYTAISKALKPQIEKTDLLLGKIRTGEVEFDPAVKYICILTVYIKRYANLLFNRKDGRIAANELRLCIEDTLEYLKLYGVKVHGECPAYGTVDEKKALFCYSFLEEAVEKMLPDMNALMLHLNVRDDFLRLHISADNFTKLPSAEPYESVLKDMNGTLNVGEEDGTAYINLTFGEETP